MPPTGSRRRFERSLAGLLLILITSAAHADPIQPSYTLTDLGGNLTRSTDASGSGISVIAANGQTAYPFVQSLAGTQLPVSQWASLPVPKPAPPVYGNGIPNWSSAIDAVQYPNGMVTAIDAVIQNYYNGSRQEYVP